MKKYIFIGALIINALFGVSSVFAAAGKETRPLNLDGIWRFQLDRQDEGVSGKWFSRTLPDRITLPGTLQGQGIGDPVTIGTKWMGGLADQTYYEAPEYAPYRREGNIKVPFWLQPERVYSGAAWFQRNIEIPSDWAGQRVVLTLERPHWKTTVWLDDREIGSNDALSVPHCYELGANLASGRHVLTIRVDNSLVVDIGINSHSITDHTQGNWNGIVGRIRLSITPVAWVDELEVYPRVADRTTEIRGRVASLNNGHGGQRVSLGVTLGNAAKPLPPIEITTAEDGSFCAEYPLGAGAQFWSEFTPVVHKVSASLGNGARKETVFGLREISAEGHQMLLNGRKLFLRGTLDCAAFPRTGHPPVDAASWRKIFTTIKAHGLNHVRFHSWCPPEAAFVAADELGLYLQVEAASWPNRTTSLGDGKPVDAWIDAETQRILRAYGNHPSFVLFTACNEPGGKKSTEWLDDWVLRNRARSPRQLYCAGAGWPETEANQYHIPLKPRIQGWAEGLKSRINALPPETVTTYEEYINSRAAPVVSHEIGQWCAYPNFSEMPKYTGYLRPRNFEIFRETLATSHMSAQARNFLIASGKLQALCYKEDIESALRTRGMGGFQLLGLSDFPGQGSALVGVLDAFWEPKGYISAKKFHRFSGPTVPLAKLERRVFTTDDSLVADIEVAHYGATVLSAATPRWKLVNDKRRVVAEGKLDARDIPADGVAALGRVEIPLTKIPAPARYKLVVSIAGADAENDWDVWVYPSAKTVASAPAASVLTVSALDDVTLEKLKAGASVILAIPPAQVKPDAKRGKIALGFSSIFWNTAWTKGQAPHTLGILANPKHPAFAQFPTDSHSNWQWWYPITNASPMILDDFPSELRPIVQVIDDWFTNRKLALVFEVRVGRGKLLVTSIDLSGDELDPVRRQLRTSLIAYVSGKRFKPSITVSAEQLRRLRI